MPETGPSRSTARATKAWRRPTILISAILVVAVVALSVYLVRQDRDQDPAAAASTSTPSPTADPSPSRPVAKKDKKHKSGRDKKESAAVGEGRLRIPSLGVSAPMVAVQSAGNELDPPDDAQAVGWWSAGARPGAETGSALLTGHTLSSGHGALQDLEDAAAGDRVTVRSGGETVRYEVTDVATYSKDELAQNATTLFDQTVPGRLVVVTCEDWDGEDYLSNVVLTAEPVS